MSPRNRRRIPRIVIVAIPAMFLGLAVLLVSIAYSSNKATRSRSAGRSPAVVVDTDQFVSCTNCHADLDKVFKQGKVRDLKYTHAMHFSKGVSDCSVCHVPDTHAPDRINKPTMSRCFTCHGITKTAIVQSTCRTCHPPGIAQKPASHLTSTWLPGGHAKEALKDQFMCTTCHQPSFCRSCHGLNMPHPEGWAQRPHATAFFDAPGVCSQCHPRAPDLHDFCDSCHHPQGPKDTPWRQFHPTVVRKESAFTCFQCHDPATCATCHVEGREDFTADRARLAAQRATPSASPTPSVSGG